MNKMILKRINKIAIYNKNKKMIIKINLTVKMTKIIMIKIIFLDQIQNNKLLTQI
jgi:hypothetical protein